MRQCVLSHLQNGRTGPAAATIHNSTVCDFSQLNSSVVSVHCKQNSNVTEKNNHQLTSTVWLFYYILHILLLVQPKSVKEL